MKKWNLNEFTGVIGVFNCQGAGWCKKEKRYLIHDQQPRTISGYVRTNDVHYLHKAAAFGWTGDTVVYSHLRGELVYLPIGASLPITLKSREYEVFTVVPVKAFSDGTKFAPVGLVEMFNSGGAIASLRYDDIDEDGTSFVVKMKIRGSGLFGVYSSVRRPRSVTVDTDDVEYRYEPDSGLVTFTLGVPEKELYLWDVIIQL